MTDIVWGDPIAVDGKRPDWLRDEDQYTINDSDYRFYGKGAHEREWWHVTAIRLPADHFAYTAIAAGFVPWGGGDEAPADWDGGNEDVMYRDGQLIGRWPRSWRHVKSAGDIIGYRRRTEQPAGGVVTIARMTLADALRRYDDGYNGIDVLRDLGLIREPSEAERIAADTGIALADVERVLAAR